MQKLIQILPILGLLLVINACIAENKLLKNSDQSIIEKHLNAITKTQGYRNHNSPVVLNQVAHYIYQQLTQYCDTVYYQPYYANGMEYKNVIGKMNTSLEERIVVGAHYDVCGNQEGADDNASGVVGVLELARMLHQEKTNYQIEFVAYTLEEPPYFRSEQMGSYIHAKSLVNESVKLKGMICLEMIGYFSDEDHSQDYPLPHKKMIYGSTGNYILLVQNFAKPDFGNTIKKLMKSADLIDTKSI